MKKYKSLGLMSGTSMDGIDLALVETDGKAHVKTVATGFMPYDPATRDLLAAALEAAKTIESREDRPENLADVEVLLTRLHGHAVRQFMNENGLAADSIDLIGFHGQTVLHRPELALTVQLGDGKALAQDTGIDVVYDLRANDMQHGGQGAPLVPVYHRALAEALGNDDRPAVFVNIGGISNITYIGADGELIAFDSGPGNALIDQWVEAHAGIPFDQGGMIASEGRIIAPLLERYLDESFFEKTAPKSLDRNDFSPPDPAEASLEDGARTLAHLTARAVMLATGHLPQKPEIWVVCGGGRLNPVIMDDMRTAAQAMGAKVLAAEDAGFNGDSMEAEAWAYLAVRSVLGLPITFPGTTGCKFPVGGGRREVAEGDG